MKKFFLHLLLFVISIFLGLALFYATKWDNEHCSHKKEDKGNSTFSPTNPTNPSSNEKEDKGNWFMSPANPANPIWYP